MKSNRRGRSTSGVEVTGISDRGIELVLDSRRVCLSYQNFPWFKGAREDYVLNVRRPHPGHLQWPDLDIDLEEESLFHPEKYPLIWNSSPDSDSDSAEKDRKPVR